MQNDWLFFKYLIFIMKFAGSRELLVVMVLSSVSADPNLESVVCATSAFVYSINRYYEAFSIPVK